MRICSGLRLIEKITHVRLELDGPGGVVGLFADDTVHLRDALTAWLERAARRTPLSALDERVAVEVMGWRLMDEPPLWYDAGNRGVLRGLYTPSTNAEQAEAALRHALPDGAEWYARRIPFSDRWSVCVRHLQLGDQDE